MSYVDVRVAGDQKKHYESVEKALRELKRKTKKEEILKDLKKHEFYMSPSAKKRFKRNEALRRRKREDKKLEWYSNNSDDQSFRNFDYSEE